MIFIVEPLPRSLFGSENEHKRKMAGLVLPLLVLLLTAAVLAADKPVVETISKTFTDVGTDRVEVAGDEQLMAGSALVVRVPSTPAVILDYRFEVLSGIGKFIDLCH